MNDNGSSHKEFAKRLLERIQPGKVFTWERFCEIAKIDCPLDKTDFGIWTHHVQMRNQCKNKFNDYCEYHHIPYRLFVQESGATLILKEKENMVITEQARIIKREGRRLMNIQSECDRLAEAEGLNNKAKAGLRKFSSSSFELLSRLIGIVPRLALPSEIQAEVMETIMPQYTKNKKDDEDYDSVFQFGAE